MGKRNKFKNLRANNRKSNQEMQSSTINDIKKLREVLKTLRISKSD